MIGVTRKLRCHSSSSGVYEGSSADRVGMKRERVEWADNRFAVMSCSEYCVCKPARSWIIMQSIIEPIHRNCGWRRDRRRAVSCGGRSRNDGPLRRPGAS